MRSGYFMMPMHPPGSFLADTLEYDLKQVERLDALGFDEAWIGEHFTAEWENIPSPEIFIAAALQRTKRITLGTGVTCMPKHNPFHLAHRIAQIDHMARGRFMWGVGSGGFIGDSRGWTSTRRPASSARSPRTRWMQSSRSGPVPILARTPRTAGSTPCRS